MGLLIDLNAFEDILRSVGIPLSIVAALFISKFLAACLAKFAYRYSWLQTITMWSLSLPQVAATLAATLIAFQAEIIDDRVFNSVILLMLVTSIAGPLITTRAAARLTSNQTNTKAEAEVEAKIENQPQEKLRVVVPVYNPQTERYLLELASLLTKKNGGEIVPLAIARAEAKLDSPQLNESVIKCQKLLAQAQEISEELGIATVPELRIEYDVAQGISHASREVNANLIILGFNTLNDFRSRLFGSVPDGVLWSAHCPVVMARLLASPLTMERILLPIESFNPIGLRPVIFAQSLVGGNVSSHGAYSTPSDSLAKTDTAITLLHVCPSGTSKERRTILHNHLATIAKKYLPSKTVDIHITAQNNFVNAIINASRTHELVILRSQRHRSGVDSLALGATTRPLLQNLNCSVVLLGEL